jgi:hypothetical protein
MKLSLVRPLVATAALALVVFPASALADSASPSAVACVSGAFGDHVEGGRVSGDESAVFAAKRAVYWIDVANTGEPTQVTLVWTLDGKEVQRQSLEVGHSRHWHTWGMRPLGDAKKVDVEVLDAAGAPLKTDSLTAH